MKIRFINARYLTMEDDLVRDGEIRVVDDRISYAGPRQEDDAAWDRTIDAKGNLILPGFKNAHTHSAMTFLRSYADDLPLGDWLTQQVFPMEAKLNGEMIRDLTKLAFLEYLTSGITACFDMYLTPDTIAEAAEQIGFRTVLVGGMNVFSQSVPEQEEWYRKLNKGGMVSYILGFHAEYTNSPELLQELAELSHRLRAPVWAHNSETKSEVEECKKRNDGMTPTQFMDSFGLFDYGGGGYHCIYLDEEDIGIFADRGLYAVTCPASNLKLASGIAPVRRLLDAGVTMAIGTDGPASNNCLDMFREMFLTAALAKVREEDAAAVDAASVLRMATAGGARAMGLKDCDTLAEGKKADLVMIDLDRPNMQPVNNIVKNLVYSGSKENVKLTMINGKILYEDGEFYVGEDPEAIYARANEIIRGMEE